MRFRQLQRRAAVLGTVKGKSHVVVPYPITNNDGKYAGRAGTSDQWYSFVKDAFDMLYREGAKHPKMMSVGLHMRMVGHPARGRAGASARLHDAAVWGLNPEPARYRATLGEDPSVARQGS